MPPRSWRARTMLAAALLLAFPAAAAPLPALADGAPVQLPACSFTLSDPIFQKWSQGGGQGGRLGCPSEKEIPISQTPGGATGRQANFAGGASILWQAS